MSAVSLDRRFANFRQRARARPAVPISAERSRRSSAAAERLAAELDGELVRTPRGLLRPGGGPVHAPAAGPGAARTAARPAAAGRSPALPRHRDDRTRDSGRDARVPRRPRMVGGQPLPAGPAPPAGPRGRAGPPRRALEPHPAERLAGHVQRPRVRLAAPRRPLPYGSREPAGPRRPPRPVAARAAGVPAPDARRAPGGPSSPCSWGCGGMPTSAAGRSRRGTSSSCDSASRQRCWKWFGTTTRTCARWRACSSTSIAATPTGSVGPRRRRATLPAWRAPSRPRAGTRRRSPASSRRSPAPAPSPALGRRLQLRVSGRAPPAPKGSPRWRSVTSGRPSRIARIQTTTVRGGRHATARISVAARAAMPCPTLGRPRIPSGVMRHGPRAACSGSEPGCCGGSAGTEMPKQPGPSSSRPAARSRRSPGSRSPSCGSTSTEIHRAPSPPRCWRRPLSSGRPASVGGCRAWNWRSPGGSRACGHGCFGLRRSRRASSGGASGEAPRRARGRQTGPGPRSPATPRQPRAGRRSRGRETRRPAVHRA